jgi:hypothetical protein
MGIYRNLTAAFALALAFAPAAASARHYTHAVRHHAHARSWDGRWAGAWGGNDPTAIIVKGNRVVAYVYGGATNPVSSSRVTAKRIVYGENNIVVTMTRTGPNTAHATIKTSQGNGVAELTRQ